MTPWLRQQSNTAEVGTMGDALDIIATGVGGAAGFFTGGPAGALAGAAAAHSGYGALKAATAGPTLDGVQLPVLDFTGMLRPDAYAYVAAATNAFRGQVADDLLDDIGAALYGQFAALYGDEAHPRDPVADAQAKAAADAAAYAASVARGAATISRLGIQRPGEELNYLSALRGVPAASAPPAAPATRALSLDSLPLVGGLGTGGRIAVGVVVLGGVGLAVRHFMKGGRR